MYNFELLNNEEVIEIFDEILFKYGKEQKYITMVLTNNRLLFLDYIVPNEGLEILRITKGVGYVKCKEVCFQIYLDEIEEIVNNENNYQVILKSKKSFEFNDVELYKLLKK